MANEITVHVHQVGPSTSEAPLRTHKVLVDRPTAKGGADLGPMGGELFMAGLGGCFMSNLLAAIRARETPISNVRTEVTGVLGEAPARFTTVNLVVSADGADAETLDRLVEIAERGCITMNTLRGKLDVQVRTAAPAR